MKAVYKHLDLGLLIARIGIGVGFIYYHGWSKMAGGPERWEGLGGAMSRFGIEFWPTFWGFMAAFSESIAAVLIVVGILFVPMSFLLAVTMFVAWIGHVMSGEGNPGHSFKNMMVVLAFLLTGPGKYSLEAWLASKKEAESGS